MSKAVLVIDMPESCSECIAFCGHYSDICCKVNGRDIVSPYPKDTKPNWCPLRKLPEKKVINKTATEHHRFSKNGWNACIDAIVGGTEE